MRSVASVCVSVCEQENWISCRRISMKFRGSTYQHYSETKWSKFWASDFWGWPRGKSSYATCTLIPFDPELPNLSRLVVTRMRMLLYYTTAPPHRRGITMFWLFSSLSTILLRSSECHTSYYSLRMSARISYFLLHQFLPKFSGCEYRQSADERLSSPWSYYAVLTTTIRRSMPFY